MKNKTQKIISFVIAVVAGFTDYLYLAFAKSMCYYSGGEAVMSFELRETVRSACYAKYSSGRTLVEAALVFLVVYIVSLVVFSFFKKK